MRGMTRHRAVLVTGMSGVGKSTVLTELARLGYLTVDTDDAGWIEVVECEPLWRETLIQELLDQPREAPLIVQGTVANQGRFYERFDAIILLSAATDVVLRRIEGRTNNPFGKSVQERARILADIAHVGPLLRQAATHEVRTDHPLSEVVDEVRRIADRAVRSALPAPVREPARVRACFAVPASLVTSPCWRSAIGAADARR